MIPAFPDTWLSTGHHRQHCGIFLEHIQAGTKSYMFPVREIFSFLFQLLVSLTVLLLNSVGPLLYSKGLMRLLIMRIFLLLRILS